MLRGEARLAVYIDLKSPYAYVAIRPTRDMAHSLGVEIDWRPFTLDIPSYLGSARLAQDGKTVAAAKRTNQQWTGVRYAYKDARRYGALTGLTLRGTEKIWDSSLAGIAMLWAKRHGAFDRFVDAVYPPFWRRELDIEDGATLERVLAETGIETEGFEAWAASEGRALHDRTNAAAFDARRLRRAHLSRRGRDVVRPRAPATHRVDPRRSPRRGPNGGEPELPGMSNIAAILDLRHPFAYLALGPTIAFAHEAGVEIDWLPMRSQTLRAAARGRARRRPLAATQAPPRAR